MKIHKPECTARKGREQRRTVMNPFRYRGYYYDTETKLYYLQTRYYDPETGRFLNMDSIDYADPENLNGLNLYAYCNNNPVMYVDPTGHFVMAIGGTMAALLSIIEIQFHPIENSITAIGNVIDDVVENIVDRWATGDDITDVVGSPSKKRCGF